MVVLILVLLGYLVYGAVLAVKAARRSIPTILPPTRRYVVTGLAAVAAGLMIHSLSVEWWYQTVGEDCSTCTSGPNAGSTAPVVAPLGALLTAVFVVAAAWGRKSYVAISTLVMWLLIAWGWLHVFIVQTGSSREHVETRGGIWSATWGAALLTVTALVRYRGAVTPRSTPVAPPGETPG